MVKRIIFIPFNEIAHPLSLLVRYVSIGGDIASSDELKTKFKKC